MATALIKRSINSLLDTEYKEVGLYVDPENAVAVNLYNKIGFQ